MGSPEEVLAEVEASRVPGLPVHHRVDLEELIRHVTITHGCDRAATRMQAIQQAAIGSTLSGGLSIALRSIQVLLAAGVWAELQADHAAHHAPAWSGPDHYNPPGLHGDDETFRNAIGEGPGGGTDG